jgi:hypothetical protein
MVSHTTAYAPECEQKRVPQTCDPNQDNHCISSSHHSFLQDLDTPSLTEEVGEH